MEVIEIGEDTSRPDSAVLRIDGYDYPVTIAPPFATEQEAELSRFPSPRKSSIFTNA
jgi:hypothetical protein